MGVWVWVGRVVCVGGGRGEGGVCVLCVCAVHAVHTVHVVHAVHVVRAVLQR